MRKLQTHDVIKFARIIKRAKLKDVIKDIINKSKSINSGDQEELEQFGTDAFFCIIEQCCEENIENMLYELLDDVTGKDIKTLEIVELIETIKDLAKLNDLVTFFKSASRLTI